MIEYNGIMVQRIDKETTTAFAHQNRITENVEIQLSKNFKGMFMIKAYRGGRIDGERHTMFSK